MNLKLEILDNMILDNILFLKTITTHKSQDTNVISSTILRLALTNAWLTIAISEQQTIGLLFRNG